jgi:hypothetical protein
VRNKLALPFEPMGTHRVKNIAEPVETFRVALDGITAAAPPRRTAVGSRLKRWWMPALGALAAVAFIGVWQFWPAEPAPRGRPAIAVLPFDNFGGDDATGRLADGITEDIITDLARFHDLDVIARNSTEVYEGKPVDIRHVGRDLNVDYVLEGSIQARMAGCGSRAS